MGRYVKTALSVEGVSENFDDANSTYDADGYLTQYTSGDFTYTNIVWEWDYGLGEQFGAPYKVITSYTETYNPTGDSNNVTITYNSDTGRVSTVTVS